MSVVYYRTMPENRPAVLVLRKDVPDGHLCAPAFGRRHCFTYLKDDDTHCDCGAFTWKERVAQHPVQASDQPLF